MSGQELDSYECASCGAWSHLPREPDDETQPLFCPYCGQQTLDWRSDTMYEIKEVYR